MANVGPPHPQNVPGPFYVEYSCCMSCDVPMVEAPGLFAYDTNTHCYVRRQPQNSDDLDAMICTMQASEVQCIRYRGSDPWILARMKRNGLEGECDSLAGLRVLETLNHVEFAVSAPPAPTSSDALAREFADHFARNDLDADFDPAAAIEAVGSSAAVAIPIRSQGRRIVLFHQTELAPIYWHVEHSMHDVSRRSVGRFLAQWLATRPDRFTDVRWYTDADWLDGKKKFRSAP